MLVLSTLVVIVLLYLRWIYRNLQQSKTIALSALSSIDNSLIQQVQTMLKVVHHAELTTIPKEVYFKTLNDYRHAFQSDIYTQHQYKKFDAIMSHLNKCHELSQTITGIAAQLDGISNIHYLQTYLSVHSEFSTLCRHYNLAVEQYNLKVKVFPSSVIAHVCQFSSLPFFDFKTSRISNLWARNYPEITSRFITAENCQY